MAAKHLTRKEIRQDRFYAILYQTYDWLADNSKLLIAGLALLLLAFLGSYAWRNYQQGHNAEIQHAFAQALETYHARIVTPDAPDQPAATGKSFKSARERNQKALEEFSRLAEDYSGVRLGHLARYYVAILQEELGQSEKAEATLKSLIESADEAEIKNLCRNYLAYVSQVQGNNEQAIQAWKAILDDPSPNFPSQKVLFNLAAAYEEVGNPEEALKHYRRLISEFPNGENARQAQSRVDYLEGQLDKGPEEKEENGSPTLPQPES